MGHKFLQRNWHLKKATNREGIVSRSFFCISTFLRKREHATWSEWVIESKWNEHWSCCHAVSSSQVAEVAHRIGVDGQRAAGLGLRPSYTRTWVRWRRRGRQRYKYFRGTWILKQKYFWGSFTLRYKYFKQYKYFRGTCTLEIKVL